MINHSSQIRARDSVPRGSSLLEATTADSHYLCQAIHVPGEKPPFDDDDGSFEFEIQGYLCFTFFKKFADAEQNVFCCGCYCLIPFKINMSNKFISQLFRALDYIHGIGICHRDIKPQNLLIDPDSGVLKLCDFGSAKYLVKARLFDHF